MDVPKFFYQKSDKYLNEVAVMAQFLPTFEAAQPQDEKPQFKDDEEELDEVEIDQNLQDEMQKTCFIFIVDRSGSMGGSSIEVTKKAL